LLAELRGPRRPVERYGEQSLYPRVSDPSDISVVDLSRPQAGGSSTPASAAPGTAGRIAAERSLADCLARGRAGSSPGRAAGARILRAAGGPRVERCTGSLVSSRLSLFCAAALGRPGRHTAASECRGNPCADLADGVAGLYGWQFRAPAGRLPRDRRRMQRPSFLDRWARDGRALWRAVERLPAAA